MVCCCSSSSNSRTMHANPAANARLLRGPQIRKVSTLLLLLLLLLQALFAAAVAAVVVVVVAAAAAAALFMLLCVFVCFCELVVRFLSCGFRIKGLGFRV